MLDRFAQSYWQSFVTYNSPGNAIHQFWRISRSGAITATRLCKQRTKNHFQLISFHWHWHIHSPRAKFRLHAIICWVKSNSGWSTYCSKLDAKLAKWRLKIGWNFCKTLNRNTALIPLRSVRHALADKWQKILSSITFLRIEHIYRYSKYTVCKEEPITNCSYQAIIIWFVDAVFWHENRFHIHWIITNNH